RFSRDWSSDVCSSDLEAKYAASVRLKIWIQLGWTRLRWPIRPCEDWLISVLSRRGEGSRGPESQDSFSASALSSNSCATLTWGMGLPLRDQFLDLGGVRKRRQLGAHFPGAEPLGQF